MALKAGYKGIKEVGPGLDYDNTTGLLSLDGESSLKLDNLEDVNIDTPLGGDVLQYDDTNEEWTNETPDTEPIEDSPELITSGAVYAGLKTLDDKISAIWSSNARTGVHNLFNNTLTSKTENGVVWAVNSDGSISTSDTSTADSVTTLGEIYLKAGKYILSGNPVTTGAIRFRLSYKSNDSNVIAWDDGEGAEFTVASDQAFILRIRYENNVSFDDKTFYPMIRLATDTDTTYTPYAMTNGELTEKVTVTQTAFSNPVGTENKNVLYKQGNVVFANLYLNGVTADAYSVLANVPSGYRPPVGTEVGLVSVDNNKYTIYPDGNVANEGALTNANVHISATWITA